MLIELTQTNAAAIGAAVLKARSDIGVSTGLVFTLIAVADCCNAEEVLTASIAAGREHPSRILVVEADPNAEDRLDATIRLGDEVPGDIISLTLGGAVAEHCESVLLPLLLPDSPVVAWWPGAAPAVPSADPVGQLAIRRITDAMGVDDPVAAIRARAASHSSGDADLAWTRLTRWRALLAAATEAYPATVTGAAVTAAGGSAAALLLKAWLADRLRVPVELASDPDGVGITGVTLTTASGDIRLARTDGTMAEFSAPGLTRRIVALPKRDLTGLISEELRRLDEDPAYSATMRYLGSGAVPPPGGSGSGR